jgi:hypothetical protein
MFGIMRSQDMRLSILTEMALDLNEDNEAIIPVGVEEDRDDESPAIQNELSDSEDSDSD